jgi:hypothetical protein
MFVRVSEEANMLLGLFEFYVQVSVPAERSLGWVYVPDPGALRADSVGDESALSIDTIRRLILLRSVPSG